MGHLNLNIIDKIVREYLDRICVEFEDISSTTKYTLISYKYGLEGMEFKEENWTIVAKDLIKYKYPVKVKTSNGTRLSFLIDVVTKDGTQSIWNCDYKVNFWLIKR